MTKSLTEIKLTPWETYFSGFARHLVITRNCGMIVVDIPFYVSRQRDDTWTALCHNSVILSDNEADPIMFAKEQDAKDACNKVIKEIGEQIISTIAQEACK